MRGSINGQNAEDEARHQNSLSGKERQHIASQRYLADQRAVDPELSFVSTSEEPIHPRATRSVAEDTWTNLRDERFEQLISLRAQVAQVQTQNTHLQQENNTSEKANVQLRSEVTAITAVNAGLSHTLTQTRAELHAVKKQHHDLVRDNSRLRTGIEGSLAECTRLHKQYSALSKDAVASRKREADLAREIAELHAENAALVESNAELTRQVMEVRLRQAGL